MAVGSMKYDDPAAMPAVWARLKSRVPDGSVLAAIFRVGSHSHGTYVPPDDPSGVDDEDYMAVVVPPQYAVYGLEHFDHAEMKEGSLDCVIYSWGKYIRLLLKSNPNVLGTLWLDPQDSWSEQVYPWASLVRSRHIFATKAALPAFAGYAAAQLHKMEHFAHQGYMGEKRKQIVSRYGYDTKNAAHLVRLLRMCSEFMVTGEMVVRRPDAAEIIEIKRGGWTLDRVKAEAERLFALCKENAAQSKLPGRPDLNAVENLLMVGYAGAWGGVFSFDGSRNRYGRGLDQPQIGVVTPARAPEPLSGEPRVSDADVQRLCEDKEPTGRGAIIPLLARDLRDTRSALDLARRERDEAVAQVGKLREALETLLSALAKQKKGAKR